MSYAGNEVERVIRIGPADGEDFYRLKLTGKAETRWLNITPSQARRIHQILRERQVGENT